MPRKDPTSPLAREQQHAAEKRYRLKHKAKVAAANAAYRLAHKEEIAANLKLWEDEHKEHRAASARLRRYGLTDEAFQKLRATQNDVCANPHCVQDAEVVDHDHETGLVRGLLCQRCNKALGMVNDDTEILDGLILYLRYGA